MQTEFAHEISRLSNWFVSALDQNSGHSYFETKDARLTGQRIFDASNGRCRFMVTDDGPFSRFRETHTYFGNLAVKLLSWNCSAKCETSVVRTPDHHIALHIPLKGEFEAQQGGGWVRVRPGNMLVVSSAGPTRRRWVGACDLLNVMIGRKAAVQTFSPLPHCDLLSGVPLQLIDLRREVSLTLFIANLAQDLRQRNPCFSEPATLPHVERLLLMLLSKSLHNCMRSLPHNGTSVIAPYYVRRAEEYIAQNYMRNVRVEEIAAAVGVSVRTIYYGFSNYRDQSPHQRLKVVRLEHARRNLIESRTKKEPKISAIAESVGYENKAQFSRDYKNHFGETPSATLRTVMI